MKKCIYTSLMGTYDTLKTPIVISSDWDYICYTNNPKLKSKIWEIRFVNHKKLHDARLARKIWILNHKYADGYDVSISIGAQIQPLCDLDVFLDKFLPIDDKIDMSIARHPNRKCIYHEAQQCLRQIRDIPNTIIEQMNFYKQEGFPKNNGLVATGVIIRKHNRPNVEKHCEKWWEQVRKWSFRDQLSFNYILWKYNLVNIQYFSFDVIRRKGNCFKKYTHKGKFKVTRKGEICFK